MTESQHEGRKTLTGFRIDPIFLPDVEIAKIVGLSAAEWKAAALVLERSGLPRRDPLFKNQRCWPRVRDFLYRRAGGPLPDENETSGLVENWDAFRKRGRPSDSGVPVDVVKGKENFEAFRKGRKRTTPKMAVSRNPPGSGAS